MKAAIDSLPKHQSVELGSGKIVINLSHRVPLTQIPAAVEEILASGKASVADIDEMRAVWEADVFGLLAVTQAFLPLLHKAPSARIVNLSSVWHL